MGDTLRRQGKDAGQPKLTSNTDGIMQTEGCMGDALRRQGKGKGQLKLTFRPLAVDPLVAQVRPLAVDPTDAQVRPLAVDPAEAETSQTNIMQTGGCMGDTLRRQGKDAGQPKLTSNTDGTLGFLAPGWGSMELKSQAEEEQTLAAAPAGSFCGSVPLTLGMGLTFHDTVDIAKKVIECKAEAETFDASSRAVSQTNIMQAES